MKINFVTSNKGKIEGLKRYLKHHNIDCEVEGINLEIVEPQANTVAEVSRSKARQAFEKLGKPVLVEDGGFYVDALKNFPGVYTRYVLDTIGEKGIIKLLEGNANKRARFCSCTTFINEKGEIFQFDEEEAECYGYVADERADCCCPHAWSGIWYIYKPDAFGKTLAELNEEELKKYETSGKGKKSSVERFVIWFSENYEN